MALLAGPGGLPRQAPADAVDAAASRHYRSSGEEEGRIEGGEFRMRLRLSQNGYNDTVV